jgi:glyoxylase-like metal-dependent hydrolase (beta-lactamase superfamily II)
MSQTPTKAFASQADLEEKKVSFTKLSDNAYAYTAEGDPNTGIIIGDDAVLVLDTQATPVMAQDVIRRIREVTDKPIKYVLMTHYHAVRVLGASAYKRRAHHRQPGHARPDRRARRAGQGQRDRPLPAPVSQCRKRAAGPDLADDDLHRQDDAVAGQAGSATAATRPRPHQG